MSRRRASPPSAQAATSLALTALRRPAAARKRARELGVSDAQLQAWVERFIDGGAAALLPVVEPHRWLTLELTFPEARPTNRDVIDLRGALARWLRARRIGNAFFMWKPPGLRLRLEAGDPEDAAGAIVPYLQSRFGARVEVTAYEPERFQFGGPVGMEIAHRHFGADSLAALEVIGHKLPREPLSVIAISDLVTRMTGDRWEAWDLICHLRLTGRLAEPPPAVAARFTELASELTPLVLDPHAAARSLPRRQRAVVEGLFAANERCATELRAAQRRRQLLYGLREIVPFWIVFHWNRWALSSNAQGALSWAMERILSPKKPR